MNSPSRIRPAVQVILLGVLAVEFNACAPLVRRSASQTRDKAFVEYWPPASDGRLRLAVKDLIDMKGVVTTAGSEHLAKHRLPASRDAACLAGARARNVQFVGRTNVTEFAISVSGLNDYYGTPRNRVSRKRRLIPGGSSSGSAVAVASGKADVAFGTDTAGSIRIPAACCGVVGLKTTHGLIPLDGVFPISPRYLDTVGPLGKDVARTATGMDLLKPGFAGKYQAAVARKPTGASIRVGRLYLSGTDPKVDAAVDAALAAARFRVVRLGPRFKHQWEQAEKDAKAVALADAWLHDRQYTDQLGVSIRTRAILTLGAVEYALRYKSALKRQKAWERTLRAVFDKVDVIAVPTLQGVPPKVPLFGGSPAFEEIVFAMHNTAAVNLGGNPALAVPVPLQDKAVHVTSLQLIGPKLSEARLLNAGRIVEAQTGQGVASAPSAKKRAD